MNKYWVILHAVFILNFLNFSVKVFQEIYTYNTSSEICPILINSISWEKPYVIIYYRNAENLNSKVQTETLKYLKITSQEHFLKIKPDLFQQIKVAYRNKHKPDTLTIHRQFPFQKMIFWFLLGISYPLCLSYVQNFALKRMNPVSKI